MIEIEGRPPVRFRGHVTDASGKITQFDQALVSVRFDRVFPVVILTFKDGDMEYFPNFRYLYKRPCKVKSEENAPEAPASDD